MIHTVFILTCEFSIINSSIWLPEGSVGRSKACMISFKLSLDSESPIIIVFLGHSSVVVQKLSL